MMAALALGASVLACVFAGLLIVRAIGAVRPGTGDATPPQRLYVSPGRPVPPGPPYRNALTWLVPLLVIAAAATATAIATGPHRSYGICDAFRALGVEGPESCRVVWERSSHDTVVKPIVRSNQTNAR